MPRVRSQSTRSSAGVSPDASDPADGGECAICLHPITFTTRAPMSRCAHVFHRRCIHDWHATQQRNGQRPNCPMCRAFGPAEDLRWPSYTFTRSLCGPWGSVTVTPDLLVVHARYLFSQPTKHLIRYSDVAKYYRNYNSIYLVDAVGSTLTSFNVRKPQELFESMAVASVAYHNRTQPRWQSRHNRARPLGLVPENIVVP